MRSSSPAEPVRSVLVRMQSPRPLSDVCLRIEELSGQVVTYEDAPFRDPGDVGRNPTGQLVPGGGRIEIRYRPGAVRRALEDAIEQHELAGLPGRFEIAEEAGVTQVVPTGCRTAAGVDPWMALLRTLISLELPTLSGLDVVTRIADAVGAAREVTVVIGSVPVNLLARHTSTRLTWTGPAGTLLLRLFREVGSPLSWQLLNDPGTDAFVLNVHTVGREGADQA